MTSRPNRFLLFADVLGTGVLYKTRNSDLIEGRRTTLGHSIRTAIYPYFDEATSAGIRINLFSDTVLVATPNLNVLMAAAAKLFHIFSLKTSQATTPDELFLLRGGIARGEILTSRSLSSNEHIEVADIFDTSLALAYNLEGVRRGSRIFLCKETYDAAIDGSIRFCHKWQAVTGIGSPVSPAFEFLWPATLFDSDDRFCDYLDSLCAAWYRLFTSKTTWDIPGYDSSLYQLDETIKLCIRSAAFAPRKQARQTWDRLLTHLPTERPELASLDIRFTWGTWFQIVWMLLVLRDTYSFLASKVALRDLIRRNIAVVEANRYMGTFRNELENPDYAWFRKRLIDLDLL